MAVPVQCCSRRLGRVSARSTIAPQSGVAFHLNRGQSLTVIDPFGEQVADVIAISRWDPRELLSPGRCVDYAGTIYLTTGHTLFSNRSRPLLTITHDTVGRHDILLTPCSSEMFRMLYKVEGGHPSCFSNLADALAPYGVEPDRIAGTFNVFMNVEVAETGVVSVLPPLSRCGDQLTLRAEMDLLVGITACSAELSNGGSFKPIEFEVS
jgi:uncharacterized protein YcgI (DUF1989 family)